MTSALQSEFGKLAESLRRNTTCEIRFDELSRKLYSTDASIYQIMPLGVVLPRTQSDLESVVQIAAENRVSIVPRGGGTSLSGQAIGRGLVIDCSKYLNRILDYDASARRVRLQPGVILDQLNRSLNADGLWFGPDVSTASRANIGGMIGNNSAGSRSIVYGKTDDHVLTLNLVLADGSLTKVEPISATGWEQKSRQANAEGRIYRDIRDTITSQADEIGRRFPNILRRVSGYNLECQLRQLSQLLQGGKASLLPLCIGSEGTLGVVAEAELKLVSRPKFQSLLVPHFDSLRAALDALHLCLESKPSAVELIDELLIQLAAANLSSRRVMQYIHGHPAALLMVEFSGDDRNDVCANAERLAQRLAGAVGLTSCTVIHDDAVREPLWSMRRSAVPLLYGLRGDRKPVAFVEDPAVAPAVLPEFADRFRRLLQQHGTDGAFYGHASVGCLHIRPLINLKESADIERMRRIMVDVTDLVLEFGGSLSGEHGDGLVRSEWNLKMFGPVIYEAFRQVKGAFDPLNLLNPGKVVNGPAMTENLRLGSTYRTERISTEFDYSRQEGFFHSIELCNGSGVCRKLQGGTMCPSFRATRDERDSTRGRANALRIALQEGLEKKDQSVPAERWLYDVMDLCLSCKACKSECPSNVDLAKLKAEFLNAYHQKHGRPLGHRLMANIRQINRISAMAPRLANWFNQRRSVRWLFEQMFGIDRRRSLPHFAAESFHKWFGHHRPAPTAGRSGKTYLLADCFTTYTEPSVGIAAVRVLESAGYEVHLLDICCGRALISKGFLREAKSLAASSIPRLQKITSDGTEIVGVEPSCILALADEWPDLVPGPSATQVASRCFPIDVWLADHAAAGLRLPLRESDKRALLHVHCHQKAICGIDGSAAALRLMPGLDVQVLDAGCCGMAGSFGYEREHFDLSVQIANLDLIPSLRADPSAIIVAPGTSCRHQIADTMNRRALHPLEVLADALA